MAQILYNAVRIKELIKDPDYYYIALYWAIKLRYKAIV